VLLAVLRHILFVTFFQFICVPFAGRHRRHIAVESCLLLVLMIDYSD